MPFNARHAPGFGEASQVLPIAGGIEMVGVVVQGQGIFGLKVRQCEALVAGQLAGQGKIFQIQVKPFPVQL